MPMRAPLVLSLHTPAIQHPGQVVGDSLGDRFFVELLEKPYGSIPGYQQSNTILV